MLLTNPETKGTAFQHARPGEILTESPILSHASFIFIVGSHLPKKSIGWLSTTRLIEYMYITAKKTLWDSNHTTCIMGFKPCSKVLLG